MDQGEISAKSRRSLSDVKVKSTSHQAKSTFICLRVLTWMLPFSHNLSASAASFGLALCFFLPSPPPDGFKLSLRLGAMGSLQGLLLLGLSTPRDPLSRLFGHPCLAGYEHEQEHVSKLAHEHEHESTSTRTRAWPKSTCTNTCAHEHTSTSTKARARKHEHESTKARTHAPTHALTYARTHARSRLGTGVRNACTHALPS